MEKKDAWSTLRNAPKQAWTMAFRFGGLFIFFEFLTLVAGVGFWMICHGIWLAGSRLVIYWKPARIWIVNLIKLQDEQYLQMPPLTWYRWIYLVIYFSIAIAFIVFGTTTLVQHGFLGQNIIYWLIR